MCNETKPPSNVLDNQPFCVLHVFVIDAIWLLSVCINVFVVTKMLIRMFLNALCEKQVLTSTMLTGREI